MYLVRKFVKNKNKKKFKILIYNLEMLQSVDTISVILNLELLILFFCFLKKVWKVLLHTNFYQINDFDHPDVLQTECLFFFSRVKPLLNVFLNT